MLRAAHGLLILCMTKCYNFCNMETIALLVVYLQVIEVRHIWQLDRTLLAVTYLAVTHKAQIVVVNN